MLSTVTKFIRWVVEKFAVGALIVLLAVAGCSAWLYLRNSLNFEAWRQDMMRSINGERSRYQTALAGVQQELAQTATEITRQQDQLRLADRIIGELKDLQSTWDRVFGDREQQAKLATRLADVTARRKEIQAKLDQLQEQYTHKTWERDGLQVAISKVDLRVQAVERQESKLVTKAKYYASQTLNYRVGHGRLSLPVKGWLVVVLGLYFLGPTAGKVTMFFVIAPFVIRGRPVRLADTTPALPEVGESRVALDVALAPGERLWIREKFLQASDEGLRRKTRYVLDWRIPFTCLAAGLVELIEMANVGAPAPVLAGAAGEDERTGEQRLTLSNQADPHSELAVVTLADGASLVVRPSFLAGVVTTAGARLRIRRRWQLLRWQAWVTLQFRFFEFVGPCRLILAGSRGIRAENLSLREGPALPARRTNQDATVGFTPNLDYRPVRAETFWSYYRGMNPLFDDLFAGRGIFICQQVATEGDAKQARKFWSAVWTGVMKLFGL
jgi:hypothetical protein